MTKNATEVSKEAQEKRNEIITTYFNKLIEDIDKEIEIKTKHGEMEFTVHSHMFGVLLNEGKLMKLKK